MFSYLVYNSSVDYWIGGNKFRSFSQPLLKLVPLPELGNIRKHKNKDSDQEP